jgi:hypothetical protein
MRCLQMTHSNSQRSFWMQWMRSIGSMLQVRHMNSKPDDRHRGCQQQQLVLLVRNIYVR